MTDSKLLPLKIRWDRSPGRPDVVSRLDPARVSSWTEGDCRHGPGRSPLAAIHLITSLTKDQGSHGGVHGKVLR